MAHTFFSLFDIDIVDSSKSPARRTGGSLFRSAVIILLAVMAMALPYGTAQAQSAYVPPVISSSVSAVPTTTYPLPLTGSQTNLIAPSTVSVDACGNIYTLDHGYDGNASLTEIPAGGGAATTAFTVQNSYGVVSGQDPTHANLLAGANYNTGFDLIPLTNCVPQPSQVTKVGGGNGALFYYYDPGYAAGDFLGNTYITTNGTCCVTGNYYLIQEVNGNGNILLSNQPNEILSLAIDKQQDVYFISGAAVFELPYSGGKYAAAPVPYGSYLNPVGLSVDDAGNLYVADSSAGAIFEIPSEGTTGPNLADQFVISSGLNINVAVAVNARGDMYYTAAGAKAVSELTLGNANFNTVAPGQTVTRVVNFQFNSAVTLNAIQAPSGDFARVSANPGTTDCVVSSAYGPGGTTSCQLTVAFKPTTVGKQSSSIVLTYTVGTSATTATISAYLEGVGQGALVTIDPGMVTAADSGVSSPAGIAVDQAGNTYIADPGNNSVVEYPAGGGAAVPVAIENASITTPLSKPLGVAVDGAGDVFIADTGNNRVVEVPFVSGALSSAASTIVASGLNAPASVFVHTNGDLYVADTGDNKILVYPNYAGPTNAGASFGEPTSLGTGLLAPLAVTVDGAGDVFIADSGNNQILEYPLGGGQEIVAANILNPSALATDSSGSLFVVDQGNFRVLRIPSIQGTLNPNEAAEVGLGIANPYGVAIDGASNLYVTDETNGAAYTIARSQIALDFGDLAVGTMSTALPLTVESAGNLPLLFNTPYFTETGDAADFAMTSPTGACSDALTLTAGSTCDLSTTFQPTVAGARTANITFQSNAANMPQLTLTGTGVSPSPTTTTLTLTTSVAGAPFYGEPLSFAATVAPGSGTPTGVVSFIIDGTQFGLLPLVNGVATLQLNSGLTGGTHTAYAVYKGDTSNNGSSSAVQTITISRAPTTPSLVVTKFGYNNPYSLRHSNAGSCDVLDNLGNTVSAPAIPSDGVGFLASVSSPGVGVPSGTLTFYSDGKLINGTGTNAPTSVSPLLPATGGVFSGTMTSDADTLGDGTTLGENNVLIGPHAITVVYSGDQNYLPSTSTAVAVFVTDVSPTTPLTLPQTPVGAAPYCTATSAITVSEPSSPATFTVKPSSSTVTASANTPGTVQLTISSLGGWKGTISMACPDLPQYTTCSSNPGVGTLLPDAPIQLEMTFTTNVPPYIPTASLSGFFWMPTMLFGLLALASRRFFRNARRSLAGAGLVALLIGVIGGLSGCGSSTNLNSITKPGSYPVTVVFTGAQLDTYDTANTGTTYQHDVPYSVSLTLNVK